MADEGKESAAHFTVKGPIWHADEGDDVTEAGVGWFGATVASVREKRIALKTFGLDRGVGVGDVRVVEGGRVVTEATW